MKLLTGKTALITGANRGIGRSIALKFAEHGANVAFSDIVYDANSKSLEKELENFGAKAKGYASDASSFLSSEQLVNDVVNDFITLDVLVNNAGITMNKPFEQVTEEQFDILYHVNVRAPFFLTQAVLAELEKKR